MADLLQQQYCCLFPLFSPNASLLTQYTRYPERRWSFCSMSTGTASSIPSRVQTCRRTRATLAQMLVAVGATSSFPARACLTWLLAAASPELKAETKVPGSSMVQWLLRRDILGVAGRASGSDVQQLGSASWVPFDRRS